MVHSENICENESRIISLETKMEYKEEKMENLLQDNKEIRKDLQKLTIAVTELSNTLKIHEEDSRRINELENELIKMKASMNTLKYLVPIAFTVINICIQLFLK